MFWRFTYSSSRSGAVHRVLDLVRALLLLDPPPYDWASELDWPHGPAEPRALQLPWPAPAEIAHRRALRTAHHRSRAGAVLERPHECLCPVRHSAPLVRSRPPRRGLDKPAVGR
jgi:hypothetical protein